MGWGRNQPTTNGSQLTLRMVEYLQNNSYIVSNLSVASDSAKMCRLDISPPQMVVKKVGGFQPQNDPKKNQV